MTGTPAEEDPVSHLAPSTDALPGKGDAEGWHRLHPFSPLLRGGIVLLVVLSIVVASFRDRLVELFFGDSLNMGEDFAPNDSDGSESVNAVAQGDVIELVTYLAEQGLILAVLGAVIGLILLIIFFSWISWRFATYRITDDAVESRNGVLFRTHRRAPLERIQSVNMQRSLLARVLGLTKIQILTGGQGGKVELAYLGYADAKIVREEILAHAAKKRGERDAAARAGTSEEDAHAQGAYVTSERVSTHVRDFIDADVDPEAIAADALVRVPVRRLVLSILLSWDTIIMVGLTVASIVGAAMFETMLIFAIIPIGIATVSVVFNHFNKGFRFTISRGRDAIRTGSGLTSTITETIPFGRIHAVEARQPLLWRPFGWWRVRVTTAGHSVAQAGQNSIQNIVLPVGLEGDVLRVLETLLPGIGDEEQQFSDLREGLTGTGADFVGAGARSFAVLLWGRDRSGIRIADAHLPEATLQVRRGVLTRSLSVMPIVRAQSILFSRPLVHRMLDLATLEAHTVLGPVRVRVRGLGLSAARDFFDLLAATILRVQAADAMEHAKTREHEQ